MTRRVITCVVLALLGLMPARAWALSGSQPGAGGEFAGPWTQNHDAGGFDLVGGSLAEVTRVQPADAASAVGVEIHGGESTVATSPGKGATVVGGSGGASGGDGGDVTLRGGAAPVGTPGKVRISSTPKTALGLPDVAAASLVDPQDGDLWWSSLDGKAYVRIAGVATDITASGGGTEAQTWTVDHDAQGFDLIGIGVITSQTTAISGVMIDQSNAANRIVTYRSVLGVEISKIDSSGDLVGIASSFDIKMGGGDIEDLNNPLRLGGTSPSTLLMSDDTTIATIDSDAPFRIDSSLPVRFGDLSAPTINDEFGTLQFQLDGSVIQLANDVDLNPAVAGVSDLGALSVPYRSIYLSGVADLSTAGAMIKYHQSASATWTGSQSTQWLAFSALGISDMPDATYDVQITPTDTDMANLTTWYVSGKETSGLTLTDPSMIGPAADATMDLILIDR